MERFKSYPKKSLLINLASLGLSALLLGVGFDAKTASSDEGQDMIEFSANTTCEGDSVILKVVTEGIPLKAYQTAEVKLNDLSQTPPKTAILAYYHLDSPDDGSYYRMGGAAIVRDRAVAFGGYDEIILQQGQIYRVSVDRYRSDKRSTAERIVEMDFYSCTSETV